MTQQEKRIRIAEACGAADKWHVVKRGLYYRPEAHGYTAIASEAWVLPYEEAKKHEYKKGDEWVTICRAEVPNYFNDLNAMAEAWVILTDNQKVEYQKCLRQTVLKPDARILGELSWVGESKVANATAAQRAEAFGRTLNLWPAETLDTRA